MPILNSTYNSFSFTIFGTYEQLITLRQERLSSQTNKMIEDLNENQPGVVDDSNEIFNNPLTKTELIYDDVSEAFDSHFLKTCVGLTTFTELFIIIPLFYFLILFDKYGEDAMKRSLNNYLSSQIAYPGIVLIIFNRPIKVWRVFVGPLNLFVADFNLFTQNSAIIWAILCQTEGFLTKALFVTSYKHINGINDKFFSNFLFLVNSGFSFGSHILLIFFGCLGDDGLMIGVENPNNLPISIFYFITIGVTSIIFFGSFLIIAVNKILAFQKEKNLVKEINITLENEHGEQKIIRFNTSKYNKPIFNTILASTNTFLLSGVTIYYITSFHNKGSHSEYIQRFWFIWGIKLVIITIIPVVMVAFFMKDFRKFIVKMFTN
jgi:hypothetical protein